MRKAIFVVLLALPACAALIDLGDEPDALLSDGGGIDPDVVSTSDAPSDVTSTEAGPPPPFVDTTFGAGGFVSVNKGVGIAAAAGDAGTLFVLGAAQEALALFHLTRDGVDAGIRLQPRGASNVIEVPQRMRVAQTGELLLGGDGQHDDAGHAPVAYIVAPDGVLVLASLNASGLGTVGSTYRGACARQGPNVLMGFGDFADDHVGIFTPSTYQSIETASDMDALRIARTNERADLACLTAFPLGPDDGVRFRVYTADAGPSYPALDYGFVPSIGALDVGVDGGAIAVALAPIDPRRALVFGQTSRRDAFFMTLEYDGPGQASTITVRNLDQTFGLARAARFGDRIYFAGCTDTPSRHGVVFRFSSADYVLDTTFGNSGRVDLDGPLGECALDVAVDDAQKVYVLLGPQGGTSVPTRVTRLK